MDIEIKILDGFRIEANVNGNKVYSDQDKASGGTDTAPNPFEYFLASVGMCVAHYVNAFCKQRELSTNEIKITEHIHRDPKDTSKITFDVDVKLPASFPEKYKEALHRTAANCAVKKAIHAGPEFKVTLS